MVTCLVSIITFFIIQNDYRKTYENKNLFFPFAQSFIAFGFIACYLFMALNYYFADSDTVVKAFPILRKHTIGAGRKSQPAVEIDYDGFGKQLVFYTGQKRQVDTSSLVLLTVKKGFFGFDIFTDIHLK